MDFMTEITTIAEMHGGIIETKTAEQHGISRAMLSKLYKEEKYSGLPRDSTFFLTIFKMNFCLSAGDPEKSFFRMRPLCFFTASLIERHLSIRSPHRQDVFRRSKSNQSARCTTSNRSYLNLERLH